MTKKIGSDILERKSSNFSKPKTDSKEFEKLLEQRRRKKSKKTPKK